MAVNVTRTITSVVVGAANIGAEYWDEKKARTEAFKNATDLSRLGITLLGLAGQIWFPKFGDVAEGATLAGIPLLMQSAYKAARPAAAIRGNAYVPRRHRETTDVRRTYEPEFNKAGVV